jgi:endonuclease/exonuclease/phosphatase family metal-dependent hydrolase
LAELPRYDVYAFSEVDANEFAEVASVLGDDYFSNLGTTGNQDRLAIAFRKSRLEFIDWYEIEKFQQWVINPGNHRSPLVYQFRDLSTNQEISVMVNHLARGNAAVRETQAEGLREWGKQQTLPVLAVGDFNFDYDFHTRIGNPGMQKFLLDSTWSWIKPVPLIDSNWADRNQDGIDDYPDSLLDFAFTSPLAHNWKASCEVLVRPGDFPDDKTTSDHRPCLLRIDVPIKAAADN